MAVTVRQGPLPAPPGTGWSRRERRSVAAMSAVVLLLHVVGWGVLLLVVAPRHYDLGGAGALGVGVGVRAGTRTRSRGC